MDLTGVLWFFAPHRRIRDLEGRLKQLQIAAVNVLNKHDYGNPIPPKLFDELSDAVMRSQESELRAECNWVDPLHNS